VFFVLRECEDMGRPISEKYKIDFVIETMQNYIDNTELPIFKEVCYQNKWDTARIYQLGNENEELLDTIKTLTNKKEVELEKGGLTGKYNPTMTVFSLKQLGWKDRQEVEVSGNKDSNSIKVEFVNNADNKS
jgi:hypothetical protein